MGVQNIKRSSIWKIRLSTATITLIPAAVGINYVAKAFAEGLKLPVWLGTLGTFLASMLAGPVAGAISGFINNVIYGLTLSPVSTVYAITSIGIGITVGVLHAKGWFSSAKESIRIRYYYCNCICCHFNTTQCHFLGWPNWDSLG